MKNVGIDIVETARIRKVMSEAFVKRVLSAEEIERFHNYSPERQIQFLAGRFAAKEAIIKCLSYEELPDLRDLNIVNDEKGRPSIRYKDYDILLSISHEHDYATAVAILQ